MTLAARELDCEAAPAADAGSDGDPFGAEWKARLAEARAAREKVLAERASSKDGAAPGEGASSPPTPLAPRPSEILPVRPPDRPARPRIVAVRGGGPHAAEVAARPAGPRPFRPVRTAVAVLAGVALGALGTTGALQLRDAISGPEAPRATPVAAPPGDLLAAPRGALVAVPPGDLFAAPPGTLVAARAIPPRIVASAPAALAAPDPAASLAPAAPAGSGPAAVPAPSPPPTPASADEPWRMAGVAPSAPDVFEGAPSLAPPAPGPGLLPVASDRAGPAPPRADRAPPRGLAPPLVDVAFAAPVAPAKPTEIAVLSGPDLSAAALGDIVGRLRARGWRAQPADQAPLAPPGRQVRFFHAADAPTARAVADEIEGTVRGYEDYRPRPPEGYLEIVVGPRP